MPIAPADHSRRTRWILAAILALAAALRLPALQSVPPPLQVDEASRGYDAWAILETGADRHGTRLPFFLEGFGSGDLSAALTTYITVPFVAVLGPTALAMRLPDALLGVATVGLLFLWLKRQTNASSALYAAAMLAVDPWHISLCRTAHESGFTPFFLVVALLAFQRAGLMPRDITTNGPDAADQKWGSRSALWALLAGLMLGAHTWAYPATRLFTPLFVFAILVIYRRLYARLLRIPAGRLALGSLALGMVIGGFPLIAAALTHPAVLTTRAHAALLIYKGHTAPQVLWQFIHNYGVNIGPTYLFFQCDELSGHMIPRVGQHLVVWAPFYAIGLGSVFAGWRKEAWRRVLIAWFLLYPIPAAICAEWNPHPMRTVAGMLLFPILAATGGDWLRRRAAGWGKRVKQGAGLAIAAAAILSFAHFADVYFRTFPSIARVGYQTALVEATRYATRHAGEADFILVTNQVIQPYIYVLLYQPICPRELHQLPIVTAQGLWGFHQVLRVGKYYFAPTGFPDAVGLFQQEWGHIRPGSEGFVIDFDRPGETRPGSVILRIPAGGPSDQPPVYLEVRRWRIEEGSATAPADGRFSPASE
jgi:4-amino-4-deoxy-L-arabinose transferase-like glycosyltransferase